MSGKHCCCCCCSVSVQHSQHPEKFKQGLQLLGKNTERFNLLMMPKNHRKESMLVQWGEQCWGPNNSDLLLHPGCWCPAKADAAAEALEEIPRKNFCASSAGPWAVRVKTAVEWHRAGLAAEGLCQMELRGLSLNRPACSSEKAPTHPVWGDLQIAVFVFGGNSSVMS